MIQHWVHFTVVYEFLISGHRQVQRNSQRKTEIIVLSKDHLRTNVLELCTIA